MFCPFGFSRQAQARMVVRLLVCQTLKDGQHIEFRSIEKEQQAHCLRDPTKKEQQALHVYSIADFPAS